MLYDLPPNGVLAFILTSKDGRELLRVNLPIRESYSPIGKIWFLLINWAYSRGTMGQSLRLAKRGIDHALEQSYREAGTDRILMWFERYHVQDGKMIYARAPWLIDGGEAL